MPTLQRTCVICSAIPLEVKPVRDRLHSLQFVRNQEGTVFERGIYEAFDTSWIVGIAETGKGNLAAALVTQQALQFFHPEIALFVGIAGGVKDVAIGDIVVADKLYYYVQGKESERGFYARPETNNPTYRLLQSVREFHRSSLWKNGFATGGTRVPALHIGPIASGETLVATRHAHTGEMLHSTYNDTLAVEMEGGGFLKAAHVENCDALVIRGISDLLDNKQETDGLGSQDIAAQNAATIAFLLLRQIGDLSRSAASLLEGGNAVVAHPLSVASDPNPHPDPRQYRTTKIADSEAVTHVKGNINSHDLRVVIASNDWLVGAVNFDEDLHFSSFYTRRSCSTYLDSHPSLGYSHLVGIYEDFRETYYVPRHECIRVAQEMIGAMRSEPAWMQKTIEAIYQRCSELSSVFKDEMTSFEELSDKTLLTLYRTHNDAHIRLYEVARIPEALDRGVATFTNYLYDYLRSRGSAAGRPIDHKTLHVEFEAMTFPEEMSAISQERIEFYDLLKAVKDSVSDVEALSTAGKRMWLRLNPETRKKLENHRGKWGYLGYHGYGTRAISDIEQYVIRLRNGIKLSTASLLSRDQYLGALEEAERTRVKRFEHYRVDTAHQALFRFHSRIGIVKLYRRLAQLRNFVFLDQLLSDVSRRKHCTEEIIRAILPEEIEYLLATNGSINQAVVLRAKFAAHVIANGGETVFAGEGFSWIQDHLREKTKERDYPRTRLQGTPVCSGVVRGRTCVVIRPADADEAGFREGDILVSESTDPDLADLIQIAGGVVTEQGGVNCHAAIVCREFGKPALVGVKHLLECVKSGVSVELNAEEGYLQLLTETDHKWAISDHHLSQASLEESGNKAISLAQMLQVGIRVPRFFVVPLVQLKKELAATPDDAVGSLWDGIRSELQAELEILRGDLFMIRPSMPQEDSAVRSYAGEFTTDAHVARQDVIMRVVNQIQMLALQDEIQNGGSIIVQEMILGDYSGVCFSRDPLNPAGEQMLVEAVPGGNVPLTSGAVVPARFLVDRNSCVASIDERTLHWHNFIPQDAWPSLVNGVLKIEEIFKTAQDVEWTVKEGTLWILQSRPIIMTGTATRDAENGKVQRRAEMLEARSATAIYAAYRVPPSVQLHMLRVAALGAWICDRWIGPQIDRSSIITTCLVHDIGNIAKANYDVFPLLFPEEMQDIVYWKAVQAQIRSRYGETDQEVTLNIAKELNLSGRILHLLEAKTFQNNIATAGALDWDRKICAYADQRVGPSGLMSLDDRLDEAVRRYAGVPTASVNDQRHPILRRNAFLIEKQIAPNISENLHVITTQDLEGYLSTLREFAL